MKIKSGANIQGLTMAMRPVLIHAERIWKDAGFVDGITVTCGLDGTHSAGSLHYYGRAVDIRIWQMNGGVQMYADPGKLAGMCDELQQEVGDSYDVIIHKTHVHVEFDPSGIGPKT